MRDDFGADESSNDEGSGSENGDVDNEMDIAHDSSDGDDDDDDDDGGDEEASDTEDVSSTGFMECYYSVCAKQRENVMPRLQQ